MLSRVKTQHGRTVAGSGYIDFDEFVAVMNEFMPADDGDQLRAAFSMMDKDGSGKISAAELKQVMRSIGERLSDDDVDEIIRELDMDGDGEVDYEGPLCSIISIVFLVFLMFSCICAHFVTFVVDAAIPRALHTPYIHYNVVHC